MKRNPHAQAAGAIPPTSDTAHVASAGRVEGNESSKNPDSRGAPHATQALSVLEGETRPTQYLARLYSQDAGTDWCDVWAQRGAMLIEAGGTV